LDPAIPLAYTYVTRLKKPAGIAGFFSREILPVWIVLAWRHQSAWWLPGVLHGGFLALYECGYLMNDQVERRQESGGGRIGDWHPHWVTFAAARVAVLGMAVAVTYATLGLVPAGRYLLTSSLVFVLLLTHSSRPVRSSAHLRFGTFTALALYRYAPVLVPLESWRVTQEILAAIFLSYGLARVIAYALRKFASLEDALRSQDALQGACLLVALPLLVSPWGEELRSAGLVWILYAIVWAGFAALQWSRIRRRCTPR